MRHSAGFRRAVAVAALFIAAVMARSASGLLRDSGRVLLEAAPEGTEVEEIGAAIAAHPPGTPRAGDDPIEILKQRYARGELSRDEYERIQRDLAA